MSLQLSPAEVEEARARLRGIVRRTPLTRSRFLSDIAGADVYLKWENLQETGSFKLRGAYNMIASLRLEERARGLVTASVGNHGAAVAYVAQKLGLEATIVVPAAATQFKIQRIRSWGAEVQVAGATYDESVEVAKELSNQEGRAFIPATEHPGVMAGQGTIAMEILEEHPETDALVVPVGGGGLIVGMAVWAKSVRPGLRVIGAQSSRARTMYESLLAGRVVEVSEEPTVADGLAGGITPENLALVQEHVDQIVLAEEARIPEAMAQIRAKEDQVIEGAAAVGVAALMQGTLSLRPEEVAVVLITGGNLDPRIRRNPNVRGASRS